MSLMERAVESFAASRPGGWLYITVFPKIDPFLLRASGGRLSISVGRPVLLLTTTGRKSGQPRSSPLLFTADGDNILLVASKAGSTSHPAWYLNLKANPSAEVLAPRGRSGNYVAREAEGEERERLWAKVNDHYAGYEAYQGRTGGRRIPVMVLEPAARP
jgi:deazaflavin-dependent oxidoreductase (nitroreductase family)